MLFTKVKVPSFNVEPNQTARMRLWSNFIRFCKYCFFVSWLRWHHLCFCWATSRKKLQIACTVNWDCIPRYLRSLIRDCAVCSSKISHFVCQFLQKISSTSTRSFIASNAIIDFLCCGSTSVGCSKLCIPFHLGLTMAKPTHCMHFITWNK